MTTQNNARTVRNHEGIVGRTDFYKVDPTQVKVVDGYNPRQLFDAVKLEELKESIKELGVLVPIRVKLNNDGEITLIDGERRLRATLMAIAEGAEIVSIPAIVERKTLNEIDSIIMSITTNSGEPLTMVEEAVAIKRLVNYGVKPEDVAKKIGKSVPTVYNRLRLLDASPEVINELEEGNISFGEVKEIVSKSDGIESQKEKLNEVKDKKAKRKASGAKKPGAKELKELLSEAVEWLTELNPEGDDQFVQVAELVERINKALDE